MIEMEWLIRFVVFVFGAIAGSFFNVCIVRMPQEKSVVWPGSHCPHCKAQIRWYDNIPFFSYIFLRGRCRDCHKVISFRYFAVEFLTAVSFLYFYLHFGLTPILIPYLVFLGGLIVATFIDLEHRIIPDEISLGGIVVGVIFSCLIPELHKDFIGTPTHLWSALRSLLGVLIGGGSIYLMGMLGDIVFKKESMGGGDVKFLAMVGAFLGWQLALLTFFIAPLFGAVFGIIVKIRTKESVIPYGPFLALGAVISLFWGQAIIDWIISGYQIY